MKKTIQQSIALLVFLSLVFGQGIFTNAEAAMQEWTDGPGVRTDATASWIDEANGIAEVKLNSLTSNKTIIDGVDYLYVLDMSGSMVFGQYGSTCLNPNHYTYYPRYSPNDLYPAIFVQEGDSWRAIFKNGYVRYLSGNEVANLSNYIFTTGYHRDVNGAPVVREYYDSHNVFYTPSWADCQNRMSVMKSVVTNSINNISSNANSRVGTVMFGGPNFANYHYDFFNRNFSNTINWINSTSYSEESGTIYNSWIDRAAYLLQTKVYQGDTRPTKLIFITDGSPTDSDVASYMDKDWVQQRASLLKSMFPNMTLYTAGIGIGSSSNQAEFLRNMASNRSLYSTINESNATADLSNMIQNIVYSTTVTADTKSVNVTIDNSIWNFYGGNASASPNNGNAVQINSSTLQWNLSDNYSTGAQYECTFRVKMTDSAKMIYGNTLYPVTSSIRTHYRVRNGPLNLNRYDFYCGNPTLTKSPPTLTTSQMYIRGDNLYSSTAGTYYVKGNTDFELAFNTYAPFASATFAPNNNYCLVKVNGAWVENVYSVLPMNAFSGGSGGESIISMQALKYIGTYDHRSSDYSIHNSNAIVQMEQDKLLAVVYPYGRIDTGTACIESPWWPEDKKLTVICDAKAPDFSGDITDREIDANTTLNFHAADDGSGMKANTFVLSAKNPTTNEIRTLATTTSDIFYTIDLNDTFFDGSMLFTLTASDNVGNVSAKELTVICNTMGLTASIERVLEPHNPRFAAGELGVLKIDVSGYVEKVTVTFELRQYDMAAEEGSTLNAEYTRTPQQVDHIEQQFYVPLDSENDIYKVIVTAYKGDKILTATPEYVVDGSILDKIRTRLR